MGGQFCGFVVTYYRNRQRHAGPRVRTTPGDAEYIISVNRPPMRRRSALRRGSRYFSSRSPYYRYEAMEGRSYDAVDDGRRGVLTGGDDR